MSEPFVGEIRMFAGNFAPRGWAFCDGQLLAVSQNDALFSLLGTVYGGDGRTTFGLPDMRGRIPVHAGQGPGLSDRRLGAKGGEERVTLLATQIPVHKHSIIVNGDRGANQSPQGGYYADAGAQVYHGAPISTSTSVMSGNMIAPTGGSQSHDNIMPSLCVNFIIALFGIYPSRH